MTPEEARRWLKEGMEKGSVPQLHARRALQTIAAMEYETHQDLSLIHISEPTRPY